MKNEMGSKHLQKKWFIKFNRMIFNHNNDVGIKCFSISITQIILRMVCIPKRILCSRAFFKSVQHINYMGRMVSVPYDYEEYLNFIMGIETQTDTSLDMKNFKDPDIKEHKSIFSIAD